MFYDHFWPFFCQLHEYLSQNWTSNLVSILILDKYNGRSLCWTDLKLNWTKRYDTNAKKNTKMWKITLAFRCNWKWGGYEAGQMFLRTFIHLAGPAPNVLWVIRPRTTQYVLVQMRSRFPGKVTQETNKQSSIPCTYTIFGNRWVCQKYSAFAKIFSSWSKSIGTYKFLPIYNVANTAY